MLIVSSVRGLHGLARIDRCPSARDPVSAAPWNSPTAPSSAEISATRSAIRLRCAGWLRLPSDREPTAGVFLRAAAISSAYGGSPHQKACFRTGPGDAPARRAKAYAAPIVTPASPGVGGTHRCSRV